MRAKISIVESNDKILLIRDLGPWDVFPTITNDAEAVIEHLFLNSLLNTNQRLIYIDSEPGYCELKFDSNGFTGFEHTTAEEVRSLLG